jgi:predicted DNA-binding transcriptional regulator YafY
MSDNRQPPAGAYICHEILLSSGDFTAKEIADNAGVSTDSVYRYIDYMVDAGSLCADYDSSVTQYGKNTVRIVSNVEKLGGKIKSGDNE